MAGPGRREEHKARTRQALRDAAFARFAEDGFAATRVADIAASCEVSERTFFRYFDSKEHVAIAELHTWLDGLVRAIEEVPTDRPPIAAIAAVIAQGTAGRFPFGIDQARDAVAYTSIPEVQHYFARVTEQFRLRIIEDFARRAGTGSYDPYVRVLGSIVSAGLFAVMESWLNGSPATGDPWSLAQDSISRVAQDFVAVTGAASSTTNPIAP